MGRQERNFMERCEEHTRALKRAISEALGKASGEHVWDVLCNSNPLKVKLVWLFFERSLLQTRMSGSEPGGAVLVVRLFVSRDERTSRFKLVAQPVGETYAHDHE
jgi:hypothetical protein